jgi:hypothetical protein
LLGASESCSRSSLLILADGDSKLSLRSYGLSCTLANRDVEPIEETVRHVQLGPQLVAEPVEIREASEVEDIDDGLVQCDILGDYNGETRARARCGEDSFAESIEH